MVHILYLAHDLDDAAIWRRVRMLEAGGASVTVIGFQRSRATHDRAAYVLGHTRDGDMWQRAIAVLRAMTTLQPALKTMPKPDVILARNLEMLALGLKARLIWKQAALVYEVLDVHRMMLGDRIRGRAMRALERVFLRKADMMITSSPGFIRHYFRPYQQSNAPIRIVENKCLRLTVAQSGPVPASIGMPPLVIGWFGILRCPRSLDCLDAVTRAAPGHYRVVMRGRPALNVLPDFHEIVAANADLEFGGVYDSAHDLPSIYGAVHLAWLVDRFDAGTNSDWLLPNRLYEGCAHGAVPIALVGTETASYLETRGLGSILPALTARSVSELLSGLTASRIETLRADILRERDSMWTCSQKDCARLVHALEALSISVKSLARGHNDRSLQ